MSIFQYLRGRPQNPTEMVSAYPPAPSGLTIYAIGDIHGRADCLDEVLALIDADKARLSIRERAIEVYLGDYVDRGQTSKASSIASSIGLARPKLVFCSAITSSSWLRF